MSILKKEEKKVDPDLYTAYSDTKMRMHYVAYVHNNRMNILLKGEYSILDETEDRNVSEMLDIPLEIFEEALAKNKFDKLTDNKEYFHKDRWKLALVPADSEGAKFDATVLNRFESAIIQRSKVIDAVDRLYPNSSNIPPNVKGKVEEAQAEVERYRNMLLKGIGGDSE